MPREPLSGACKAPLQWRTDTFVGLGKRVLHDGAILPGGTIFSSSVTCFHRHPPFPTRRPPPLSRGPIYRGYTRSQKVTDAFNASLPVERKTARKRVLPGCSNLTLCLED